MTAVLCLRGPSVSSMGDDVVTRMLDAMSARGGDARAIWRGEGVVIATTTHDWQTTDQTSRAGSIAVGDGLAVAADASLYYRDDLRERLAAAGVRIGTDASAAQLILAAFRAWGERLTEHVEGDYAFVLSDARSGRVVCARDFVGTRPLHHATLGDTLVIASRVQGVEAHPACACELDAVAIGEQLAGFVNASDTTHARGVRRVRAGHLLAAERDGALTVRALWTPPAIDTGVGPPIDEAAEELRRLLGVAVSERCDNTSTAIWLSGGWDSTAVFAAGEHHAQSLGRESSLRPVSMSYPPDDMGYEDDLIQAVADRWNRPVFWVHSKDVPVIAPDPVAAAALRDGPVTHAFEQWNRALGAGARDVGARVALNGHGGDHFFSVTSIYLAELLRSGQWRELANDWVLRRGRTLEGFWDRALAPALPPRVRELARTLRNGRPLPGTCERQLPSWIDVTFARRAGLVEREHANAPRGGHRDLATEETYWMMADALHSATNALVYGMGIDSSVEVRMPMYDRRIVEFASARPRCERASGRESKILLRRAMQTLLPDHVLAPRSRRTGMTSSYLVKSLKAQRSALERLGSRRSRLAQLGIVDVAALGSVVRRFLSEGAVEFGGQLYNVLQAEYWLESRASGMHHRNEPKNFDIALRGLSAVA
jgi:asparagine synthase (glutamine-hydrolysing)